jgi:4-diphosphocytidyl-2-C-methyl-D-erythritol kinase
VFVPLDLCDRVELAVEPAARARVEFGLSDDSDPIASPVPRDARNLAARAASEFLSGAGLSQRVSIRLRKRVPPAAGLGGGSSDAGAVLRGLAARFPDAYTRDDLAQLALGLGADVPYFLDPRPALVRGVGERVEPLAGLGPLALVLANPGLPLTTAAVYAAYDALVPAPAAATDAGLSMRVAQAWPDSGPPGADFPALLANDLEAAAIRLCPPVARLRRRLDAAGALAVGMSGSGPTLFGVFADAAAAAAGLVRAGFEPPVWARVATTVESR